MKGLSLVLDTSFVPVFEHVLIKAGVVSGLSWPALASATSTATSAAAASTSAFVPLALEPAWMSTSWLEAAASGLETALALHLASAIAILDHFLLI